MTFNLNFQTLSAFHADCGFVTEKPFEDFTWLAEDYLIAKPTDTFWDAWREDKYALKKEGYAVTKYRHLWMVYVPADSQLVALETIAEVTVAEVTVPDALALETDDALLAHLDRCRYLETETLTPKTQAVLDNLIERGAVARIASGPSPVYVRVLPIDKGLSELEILAHVDAYRYIRECDMAEAPAITEEGIKALAERGILAWVSIAGGYAYARAEADPMARFDESEDGNYKRYTPLGTENGFAQ